MVINVQIVSLRGCLFKYYIPSLTLLDDCFVTGDGIGGTEKKMGATSSKAECITKVKSSEPTANGATYGRGTCWAEFGMTGPNSNADFQTCKF